MLPPTVLLVEDEGSVRWLCALLLERAGYLVFRARNAAEAIQLSDTIAAPIRLLIVDVVLPDTDGAQLARRLAATRPRMEVLLLSGYPDKIVAADSWGSDAPRFLAKPFTTAEFLTCVRELLPHAQAEAA